MIGASLGGLEALEGLLARLPPAMPPIAIVQHRIAEDDGSRLRDLLHQHSALPVVEPDDKTPIAPGTVYLAPSDYHLLVEPGHLALSTEASVQHARPSIDVLFETAADAYGARVVAVVLTCASVDGVDGARAIRRQGGRVLVQDPAGARSPILPLAVIDAGLASEVVPLPALPERLVRACGISPAPPPVSGS